MNKFVNLSSFSRVVIEHPLCNLRLICEDGQSMNLQGIDIAKHIEKRFVRSIAPDKVTRLVLHFSRDQEPKLIASRAYGSAPANNGAIVSSFCWESNPLINVFEWNVEDRLNNIRSLGEYGYSLIIGRTHPNWESSGYVYKADLRRIRPSRDLVVGVLAGLRGGNLYSEDSPSVTREEAIAAIERGNQVLGSLPLDSEAFDQMQDEAAARCFVENGPEESNLRVNVGPNIRKLLSNPTSTARSFEIP